MAELKIYLTSWQKRQVKDYCGNDVSVIAVPIDGGFKALYMAVIPPPNPKSAMYLTDEQMAMVVAAFGDVTPCHYLDLDSKVSLTLI